MAKVTVVYDREGNTLDVWFTKPQKAISEEVGHGIVLKKNKRGRVLGFEKINFLAPGEKILRSSDLHFEAKVA
jgi:Protein of unknown function (DUF2283)